MEYSLSMTFLTTTNAKATITISGIKEDLTKEQVSGLMDTLIAKNVFSTKSGDLASKSGASITKKQVTKIEVA